MPKKENVLEIVDLKKFFLEKGKHPFDKKKIVAINGIKLSLKKGETMGIVGESGSGKSTLARCILKILKPDEGKILFHGMDISLFNKTKVREFRRNVQMVFQDPEGSLNPRFTVYKTLLEPLKRLKMVKNGENKTDERIIDLLKSVGLSENDLHKFPHQFSGGQQQRVGIARAISTHPKLLVLDEPTSALDVSVRAQILDLLLKLKENFELSYLFISHDLRVISIMADRVAVMYLGEIVETAETAQLLAKPLHPYTEALLSAIPDRNKQIEETSQLAGEIPSPSNPPEGCCFHTRCKKKMTKCEKIKPSLVNCGDNHFTACHLYQ